MQKTKKKQCPFWPTGREVMTTYFCWVVGYYQLSISNNAKHSSQTYRRAGQRCFGLLALISRPQVRYIYLSERMILPGSLIPSDKYILERAADEG